MVCMMSWKKYPASSASFKIYMMTLSVSAAAEAKTIAAAEAHSPFMAIFCVAVSLMRCLTAFTLGDFLYMLDSCDMSIR